MLVERELITNITSRLIEIPSLSLDTVACKRALEVVKDYLKLEPKVFEKNGILSYLWGSEEHLLTPRLLLSGHVDVVDVEGNSFLFSPQVENIILRGRGAGDMKGYVASIVTAYKKWVDEGGPRDVGLLLTSDEEIGGFNGTRHVIVQGLKPTVVLVPDGEFNFSIVESQKAPHHFVIKATGQGGHASRAFQLDNPINRMFKFYFDARRKFSLATKDDNWKSTFEMTVINTENQSKNKIPDNIVAAFSWRWPLEQITFDKGRNQILKLCRKYNCQILEEEGGGEGCLTDKNAPFVKTWKTIIEGVIGKEVTFINMHGATDGRHFYNSERYGTKNVLTTSGISGGHHKQDEWVDIESLLNLSEAIYAYQKQLTT